MNIKLQSIYKYDCYRDDKLIWTEEEPNLVTNQGVEYAMALIFDKGLEATKPEFYCGLISGNVYPVVEDTMQDHGFAEFLGYTSATRAATEFQRVEGQVATYLSNEVSRFYMKQPGSIRGAFMTTGVDKGGSDGYLYGASVFDTFRQVVAGDLLRVSITVRATG